MIVIPTVKLTNFMFYYDQPTYKATGYAPLTIKYARKVVANPRYYYSDIAPLFYAIRSQ